MKKILIVLLALQAVGCKSLQRALNPHDDPMNQQSASTTPVIEGTAVTNNDTVDIHLLVPSDTIIIYANGELLDRYSFGLFRDKGTIRFAHEITRLPGGKFRIESAWAVPAGTHYRIEGYDNNGELMP